MVPFTQSWVKCVLECVRKLSIFWSHLKGIFDFEFFCGDLIFEFFNSLLTSEGIPFPLTRTGTGGICITYSNRIQEVFLSFREGYRSKFCFARGS